jgi:hypothetical protein
MGHLPETWGEPGHRVATPISSITHSVFVKQCDQIREAQGTSTAKLEWIVRAADNTVLSYELFTTNTETASTMEFVLRREGVVAIPEVRADIQRIHRFLAKEQLHTVAEGLLDTHINPPPAP